jgi:hypothetical protein
MRVDVKKLMQSKKFKKDCESAKRILNKFVNQKDPAWHEKVFESFLNDLEKVLDERKYGSDNMGNR